MVKRTLPGLESQEEGEDPLKRIPGEEIEFPELGSEESSHHAVFVTYSPQESISNRERRGISFLLAPPSPFV